MRRTLVVCALLSVAGLLAACLGSWGRPERAKGDAAWISDPATSDGLDLAKLESGGLGELFAEAASLEWDGSTPRLRVARIPAALAGERRITLVVTGNWSAALGDSKAAGARLAAEIKRIVLDAQARGVFPVGVHLDLEAARNLTSYAQGLRAARSELAKALLLSATIERSWLSDEATAKVARAVDYCVVFIYGQRPGEADQTGAWDLQEVAASLKKVEALGCPYLAGIVTLGSVTHQNARGEALESTTALSLGELVRNPRLKLQGGFTLEGLDRLVYGFRAEAPATVGSWRLERGDAVRVVGTAPTYVRALRTRIAEVVTTRHRGDLYYRLPLPTERLTPSAEELLGALAATAPAPDLALSADLVERTSQHWLFTVTLENRNDEHSDVAMLDNNFVEVTVDGGLVGAVSAGAFHRFELLRKGSDAVDMAALRAPDRARLYLPVLDGRARYTSGPIELRVKDRRAQVGLSASFLLPDGRIVTAPSVVWTPPTK